MSSARASTDAAAAAASLSPTPTCTRTQPQPQPPSRTLRRKLLFVRAFSFFSHSARRFVSCPLSSRLVSARLGSSRRLDSIRFVSFQFIITPASRAARHSPLLFAPLLFAREPRNARALLRFFGAARLALEPVLARRRCAAFSTIANQLRHFNYDYSTTTCQLFCHCSHTHTQRAETATRTQEFRELLVECCS